MPVEIVGSEWLMLLSQHYTASPYHQYSPHGAELLVWLRAGWASERFPFSQRLRSRLREQIDRASVIYVAVVYDPEERNYARHSVAAGVHGCPAEGGNEVLFAVRVPSVTRSESPSRALLGDRKGNRVVFHLSIPPFSPLRLSGNRLRVSAPWISRCWRVPSAFPRPTIPRNPIAVSFVTSAP